MRFLAKGILLVDNRKSTLYTLDRNHRLEVMEKNLLLGSWIPMAFVQERYLKRHFDTRRDQALAIIQSYRIPFQEVGVFGSYARGDYTTKSDIDLCMIMETRPDRYTLWYVHVLLL